MVLQGGMFGMRGRCGGHVGEGEAHSNVYEPIFRLMWFFLILVPLVTY